MKEAKAKNYTTAQLATVIAFAAVILAFFALLILLPKHAGEMSELEFRSLADHPIKGVPAETLAKQLVRGDLSDNVDTFLEDHFPARSFFIALNSYGSRLTGRNAVQSVVAGKEGRMFDAPQPISFDKLQSNLEKIDAFAADNGLETELVIVPSAAVSVTDELPLLHPVYRDAEAVSYAMEHSAATVWDIAELYSHEDASSMFYRTDHHWTMDGAYVCYRAICEKNGIAPVEKADFTVDSYDFYGSFYRKAGMWLAKPDKLEVWRSPVLDAAKVKIGAGDSAAVHEGVYDESKLREGVIDKYAAYVYSNNGVTVIQNPAGDGEAVMIVKDSFGNSIAPLFAMNTRYYTTSLPDPSELVREYGVTRLIVVFGTESVVTESYLAYLR